MTNKELIEYFESGIKPFNTPVLISPGVRIIDYDGFLKVHLARIKLLGENITDPIALRLRWLKEAIEKGA